MKDPHSCSYIELQVCLRPPEDEVRVLKSLELEECLQIVKASISLFCRPHRWICARPEVMLELRAGSQCWIKPDGKGIPQLSAREVFTRIRKLEENLRCDLV